MSEPAMRQLSLLDEYAPPRIEIEPPSSPGSESSRAAAELIEPFRRKSWRRILLTLAALRPGQCLSREEIAARIDGKEGPLCARLSELVPTWIEVLPGACCSSSGVRVNGYRITQAGRGCVHTGEVER